MRLEDSSDRDNDTATSKELDVRGDDVVAHEYLHGMRLLSVTSGLTLVMFLGMMDVSIIATVSHALLFYTGPVAEGGSTE